MENVLLPEAVNLELVNLNKTTPSTITGGHHDTAAAKRKDTQVDIGNPYDEYFVPVNEHRKFMR